MSDFNDYNPDEIGEPNEDEAESFRDSIPEHVDPDDPDYDMYKEMSDRNGGGPMPLYSGGVGFKMVPDGKGGFNRVPMTPEELARFQQMLFGSLGRYTGAPDQQDYPRIMPPPRRPSSTQPIGNGKAYPQFLFMKREYIVQFVNGLEHNNSPEVTVYAECIPNPAIKHRKHTIVEAYEMLKESHFMTFLLNFYGDLYLWDYAGMDMKIAQNVDPKNPYEKIVMTIHASKKVPSFLTKFSSIDYVSDERTDIITPFVDSRAQIMRSMTIRKHIYEPVIQAELSFAINTASPLMFTDDNVDVFALYTQLVLPAIFDARNYVYPEASWTSNYARKTLESLNILFETHISDNLFTVNMMISPAYITNAAGNIYRYLPKSNGGYLLSMYPVDKMRGGSEGNSGIFNMLNVFCSSVDSQVLHLDTIQTGGVDLHGIRYESGSIGRILISIEKLVSDVGMNSFGTVDTSLAANKTTKRYFRAERIESMDDANPNIMGYIKPTDKIIIPSNLNIAPSECKIWIQIYGFVEFDLSTLEDKEMTFAQLFLSGKDEIDKILELPTDLIANVLASNVMCMESWVRGNISRWVIGKLAPMEDFVDPEIRKAFSDKMAEIQQSQPTTQTSPFLNLLRKPRKDPPKG